MALADNGSVYSWGDNYYGQLGLKIENNNNYKPKLIQLETKIKKISCGRHHSLLLSYEGNIYVFGWNHYRQLGVITEEKKQWIPIKMNHSEKFIDIASHYQYHISAALSDKGLYYFWGECGEKGIISSPKETQFKSFEEIFAITNNHSI